MRRLIPPVLLLLLVIAMAIVHVLASSQPRIPSSLRWLGIVPIIAGLAFAALGRREFVRVQTNIWTFGQPGRLVTTGPFALSRNPMYLGMALVAVGAAISFGDVAAFGLAALFVVIADRWYIAFEEERMAATFGEAYETYRRSTRRWV